MSRVQSAVTTGSTVYHHHRTDVSTQH